MASTASGIEYPVAGDFIAPLNAHLQALAETTQTALDARAPAATTSYTPTLSGITLGNGTVSAKSCKVGGMVIDNILITFGGTTAVTGDVVIGNMPAAANLANTFCGNANLHDAGSSYYVGVVRYASSTSVNVYAVYAGGTYTSYSTLNSTTPHTWAVGDQIAISTVRIAA